jgi:Fe-S cluster assembly protein SufD
MFKLLNAPKLTENQYWPIQLLRFLLKNDAIVDFYKIQNDNLTANLIDNTYVSQKQESSVAVNTFSLEET